jgi:hypothetical protein
MFSAANPEVLAAEILFLGLLPIVLFAPLRWAIITWLIMGNLDMTGGSVAASESLGWMNAGKGVLLPLYLLGRIRKVPSEIATGLPARLWIGLVLYASVASVWSPFPVAAGKIVGNMVGILLTFMALEKAARRNILNAPALLVLVTASLALGAAQTVFFNAYGFDGVGRPVRLSSFVTAQQYASFLVAFLAIALWHPHFKPVPRTFLVLGSSLALILNGSRTWFAGALMVVAVYLWQSHAARLAYASFGLGTITLGALLAFNLQENGDKAFAYTSSRIAATASALITGEDTPERAGLANLNFRLAVYDGTLKELRSANLAQLLIGHGTSSGGKVVLNVFPRAYKAGSLDPNRVLHNEWLRALYEWGIGGLSLVVGVMASLVWGLVRRYRDARSRVGSAIALSFAPAFLLAFSTENLIAGAGNAVTMGLALLVALSWAPIADGRNLAR